MIIIPIPELKPKLLNYILHPANTYTLQTFTYHLETHSISDEHIAHTLHHLHSIPNHIIAGDINAHAPMWHSPYTDHRGQLIEDLISNSNHLTLNKDTPTRIPNNPNQQQTSPDITTISDNLYNQATWTTAHQFSSDHLPIITTFNSKSNYQNTVNSHCLINYNKANWPQFTSEIENILANQPTPTNVHIANKILTSAIHSADKHNIPRGKLNLKVPPLPAEILDKINERNNLRKTDSKHPNLQHLNNQINKLIQTHKTNYWKTKLSQQWDHKTNSKTLWNTINSLAGKRTQPQSNRTITFHNKIKTTATEIATSFNKQFTRASPHQTNSNNRKTDRSITQLPKGQHTPITNTQVITAIKNSKPSKSSGPDDINTLHLKHLGPNAINFLTTIYNLAIETNTIPHTWKLAKIVPIPKPNKNLNEGTSYRPISLLSPIAKTLEKIILPQLTSQLPNIDHQHGFKTQHSTTTALHQITNQISQGFNQPRPPMRTVLVSLDMSKAFDTVNHHKLLNKLLQTTTAPIIIKFISNYIKGRKAYTTYNQKTSKQKLVKSGVPQGSSLSPILFNLYTSDIPTPPPEVHLFSYADDLNTLSSHQSITVAQNNLQPYLNELYTWTKENDLLLNPTKSQATVFTPDPAEFQTQLTLTINQKTIPTVKHPKILGITFDPKLTFSEHIKTTKEKADKTTNILKALTTTQWGKSKETITASYNAITRPIIEYASTIWSPITSITNLQKLQSTQNKALRIATGCTLDTNIHHIHQETYTLPLEHHLRLHASNFKQKCYLPSHPLQPLLHQPSPPRTMKPTIFNCQNTTSNPPAPTPPTTDNIQQNIKQIHTLIVNNYLQDQPLNKVLNDHPPAIDSSEQSLPRHTRTTLAQLRTNKSPFLLSYLHKINATKYISPLCPLCRTIPHDTTHLFQCPEVQTSLTPQDLWKNPHGVAALLETWSSKLDPAAPRKWR